jgi:hypothetical protein
MFNLTIDKSNYQETKSMNTPTPTSNLNISHKLPDLQNSSASIKEKNISTESDSFITTFYNYLFGKSTHKEPIPIEIYTEALIKEHLIETIVQKITKTGADDNDWKSLILAILEKYSDQKPSYLIGYEKIAKLISHIKDWKERENISLICMQNIQTIAKKSKSPSWADYIGPLLFLSNLSYENQEKALENYFYFVFDDLSILTWEFHPEILTEIALKMPFYTQIEYLEKAMNLYIEKNLLKSAWKIAIRTPKNYNYRTNAEITVIKCFSSKLRFFEAIELTKAIEDKTKKNEILKYIAEECRKAESTIWRNEALSLISP